EIFRGIGFVVRDSNWGTPSLPATASITESVGEVRVSAAGRLEAEGQDLSWEIDWLVTEAGLEARVRGRSSNGFRTNRTGFVAPHSAGASRGQPVRIGQSAAAADDPRFPDLVSPGLPFFDIFSMSNTSPSGAAVALAFKGEVFEADDQRSWTDVSFKTSCLPLA